MNFKLFRNPFETSPSGFLTIPKHALHNWWSHLPIVMTWLTGTLFWHGPSHCTTIWFWSSGTAERNAPSVWMDTEYVYSVRFVTGFGVDDRSHPMISPAGRKPGIIWDGRSVGICAGAVLQIFSVIFKLNNLFFEL